MPLPGKLLVLAAALAVFAPGASGYASYVGCERSLVDGCNDPNNIRAAGGMMGAQIVRSSASTVRLVHDGRILPCGASLVAGQELEFNTSKVHGQYIIEVARPHEA